MGKRSALVTCIAVFVGMMYIAGATETETIKIGWIGPLSGWGAAGGTAIMRGTQLAIDHLNAKSGVEGLQLELDRCWRFRVWCNGSSAY